MKNLFFWALLFLTSLKAFSEKRPIVSQQFIIESGQFEFKNSLDYLFGSLSADDFDYRVTGHQFSIRQKYSYALSDASIVFTSLGYSLLNAKTETNDFPSQDGLKGRSQGFQDVSFGYHHRVFDHFIFDSNLDVKLVWSPKISEAKSYSQSKNGNMFSGRHTFYLESLWGASIGRHSLISTLVGAYYGETVRLNQLTEQRIYLQPSFVVEWGVDYQFFLSDRNALGSGIVVNYALPVREKETELVYRDTGLTPKLKLFHKYSFTDSYLLQLSVSYARQKDRSDTVNTTTKNWSVSQQLSIIF